MTKITFTDFFGIGFLMLHDISLSNKPSCSCLPHFKTPLYPTYKVSFFQHNLSNKLISIYLYITNMPENDTGTYCMKIYESLWSSQLWHYVCYYMYDLNLLTMEYLRYYIFIYWNHHWYFKSALFLTSYCKWCTMILHWIKFYIWLKCYHRDYSQSRVSSLRLGKKYCFTF